MPEVAVDTQSTPPEVQASPAAETYLAQRLAAGEGEQTTPAAPDPSKTEIPIEIQQALIELATRYEQQCDWMTRGLKRQIIESEEFWKGNHSGIWDESQFSFWTPQDFGAANPGVDVPRYDYVTNLFRTWGEIAINAIARIPKVRARPASAKSEKDIATAKAFSKIANLIEKNNEMEELVQEEARLLYVQGGFGSYVRFLRSEDYGVKDETVVEMRPQLLREAGLECPTCGESVPLPAGSGLSAIPIQVPCPNCGAPLDDSHAVPQEFADAPTVVGTRKVPEGREVITTHGLLNLKLLPYANNQSESPYLINSALHPTAFVRASWPLLADKIGQSGTDGIQTTSDSQDSRYFAQLAAPPRNFGPYASTGSTLQGMTLLKQAWIRASGFWEHPSKDMVKKLLKQFPDGVHFNYVGKLFLSGQNENMDKFWRVCIGPLGNGIYRGGTGQSGISINKRFNDVANIQQEYVEHAAFPTVLGDGRFLSAEGWMARRQDAGGLFLVHPEHAGHQTRLADMIHQPTQKLDGNIYQYGSSLEKLGEYVTGSLPTVAGGGVQYQETLGGYSQAREDALGRLRLVWKRVRVHHARLMGIAIECFRENRTEDAELSVIQESGEFAAEYVRLDEVQGNVIVEPEADEDFPSTTSELRGHIVKMLQYAPELAMQWLQHPANVEFTKRVVGDPELILPAEAAREKTLRDIDNLSKQEPAGWEQQGDQLIAVPSIRPEMFVDDHTVAIITCQDWCRSSDPGMGMEVKQKSPASYANVVGYLYMSIAQLKQEQEIMAPPPQVSETGGAAGEKSTPNS